MRSSVLLSSTQAALSVLAAIALTACGGGGCNPCEPDQQTPRVDCVAHPEQCK